MIVIKRYVIIAAAVIVLTAITSGAVATRVYTDNKNTISVVVDAGHGSPDGGAVGFSKTEEKDINLSIAKKLCEVLEGKGIRVIMTRKEDSGIWDEDAKTIREKKVSDMNNRLEIMKKSKADLFLSIHMNSFSDSVANGLRVFYDKNHPEGEEIAKKIQDSICKITGAEGQSIKTADSKLFLMKNPPMPSILIECGFISNPKEEEKLKNDEYQSEIAWAIAESVEKCYETLTNQKK